MAQKQFLTRLNTILGIGLAVAGLIWAGGGMAQETKELRIDVNKLEISSLRHDSIAIKVDDMKSDMDTLKHLMREVAMVLNKQKIPRQW